MATGRINQVAVFFFYLWSGDSRINPRITGSPDRQSVTSQTKTGPRPSLRRQNLPLRQSVSLVQKRARPPRGERRPTVYRQATPGSRPSSFSPKRLAAPGRRDRRPCVCSSRPLLAGSAVHAVQCVQLGCCRHGRGEEGWKEGRQAGRRSARRRSPLSPSFPLPSPLPLPLTAPILLFWLLTAAPWQPILGLFSPLFC